MTAEHDGVTLSHGNFAWGAEEVARLTQVLRDWRLSTWVAQSRRAAGLSREERVRRADVMTSSAADPMTLALAFNAYWVPVAWAVALAAFLLNRDVVLVSARLISAPVVWLLVSVGMRRWIRTAVLEAARRYRDGIH